MKRIGKLLALLTALALLAGCSGLNYENLYALPRASEAYYDLQDALSTVTQQGYVYLAPAGGARQEPVQLTDLDGDEVDEAVAFFRSGDLGEVKVYIFSQDEGVYTPTAVIDGAGSAISAVEYADLDGEGAQELILTYQVSEAVTQALQVYRYTGGEAVNLLTTACSRYGIYDLDGDGNRELACLTNAGAENPAVLECYDGLSEGLSLMGEQRLRFSYDSLRRVQNGRLWGDALCLVYSGLNQEGQLLTDVFTAEDGTLRALQPEPDVLISSPIHSYYVYPEDMDGDGRLELPQTRQLPPYDDGSAAQWVVDWYGMDRNGACHKRHTTFENPSEGWSLEVPEPWDQGLTIKATDESVTVSTVTLYRRQGSDAPQEILTIYTLRGTNRNDYAAEHSLTILYSGQDAAYAVTLAAAEPWEGTVTLSQVSELFHPPDAAEENP